MWVKLWWEAQISFRESGATSSQNPGKWRNSGARLVTWVKRRQVVGTSLMVNGVNQLPCNMPRVNHRLRAGILCGRAAPVKCGRAAQITLRASQPLCKSSLQSGCKHFLFLSKRFLFKPSILNKLQAFHTGQLSNQTGDYPGQGPTRPNFSPFSRCRPTPKFLW